MTADLLTRLRGLAAFVPQFESPDFRFGRWEGGEPSESGIMTLPMYQRSEVSDQFVRAAYDLGWVPAPGCNWVQWKQTPEAIRLRDDPAALAAATPPQLARLLTVLIRQDRFCEGSLAGAFRYGLLTAICRRAAALADELEQTTP
jgi:hypothetical protein